MESKVKPINKSSSVSSKVEPRPKNEQGSKIHESDES